MGIGNVQSCLTKPLESFPKWLLGFFFIQGGFKVALYSETFLVFMEAAVVPRLVILLTPNLAWKVLTIGFSDGAFYFSSNVFCKFTLSQFVSYWMRCRPGGRIASGKSIVCPITRVEE